MTTTIPDWMMVLVGVPVTILVVGWWVLVAVAFVHFVKTAHFKEEE